MNKKARIAVDIGGTFTDVALEMADGSLVTAKTLTTPKAPDEGVIAGVGEAMANARLSPADIGVIIHGTTLATNALIEKRGAKTALLTTEGHRDSLEMAYENRFEQYDVMIDRPPPLVPRWLRLPVRERLNAQGEALIALDEASVRALIPALEKEGVESLAIGFLHSYANPAHEQRAAEIVAKAMPGLSISLSSDVAPEIREYERQTTTVANNSIIFGTSPFITAGLVWLMIRERPSAPTLVCSVAALAGALIVMGSSFRLSGAAVVGDALAVLMTVSFAIKTVLVRQHREVPMVPAACVGALMGSVGAIPFVQEWSLSAGELAQFALFGFTQQGAGLILTTLAMARIPAAHAALLMAFDLPLSPLWVWLAYGERPTLLGLIGGLVVLTAIIAHVILEGRRRR